jgi:hypothetical protein
MQATAFLAVALVVGFIALVVLGAAWFIAIPLAFLVFLIPVAFVSIFAAKRAGLDRGTHPTGSQAMPSSREASYDPRIPR